MILNNDEKQEAWMALGQCIVLDRVQERYGLSQQQIDYLVTFVGRKSFPGVKGRKLNSVNRWNSLDYAFEILKARQPDRSNQKIFEAVADHYGCGWSTVRKARQEMRPREFSFAGRHKQLGFTKEDFATLALPHINFDSFSDE